MRGRCSICSARRPTARSLDAAADEHLPRRPGRRPGRVPLQGEGRGTRGMAMLVPGRRFQYCGPARYADSDCEPEWKNIVVLGRGVGLRDARAAVAACRRTGVGVTAILSARSPDVLMSQGAVRGARRTYHPRSLDTDSSQRRRECRKDHRELDRRRQSRCLLHLRFEPATQADAAARQEAQHPRPGRDGADHGVRVRRLLRLHAHLRGRR